MLGSRVMLADDGGGVAAVVVAAATVAAVERDGRVGAGIPEERDQGIELFRGQ